MRYFLGLLAVFAGAVALLVQCGAPVDPCVGVDCDDANQCTEDTCDATRSTCRYVALADQTECDFDGFAGVCIAGVCRDPAKLCEGITCDDENECTEDLCNASDGSCEHEAVAEDTPCADGAGLCHERACYGTLTLHSSQARMTMSGTVRLTVEPQFPGWTIAKIEFFDGPDKIGETDPADTGFSIEVPYTRESNGLRTLTARAYDPQGYVVTTDPITLEVDIHWIWVRQFSHDARAVASDHGGSVYAVGKTKRFPDQNAAITKFDSNGNARWTRFFGSENAELAHSVAVDPWNNVYVAGEAYLYPDMDLILFKYDPNGGLLWDHQIDLGTGAEQGGYVAVDGTGAAYFTGWSPGATAAVMKYSSEGTLVWSRDFIEGSSADIAIDPTDGIYVVGNGFLASENEALFVVKYDVDGNRIWERQLEGASRNVAHGAGAFPGGGVCVAGTNRGGLDGSPATAWTDPFVACYDSSGDVMWIRQLDIPWGHGAAVAADSSNVYVVGIAHGNRIVAGEQITGYGDTFLARYDHSGGFASIYLLTSINGTIGSYDQGEGVAVRSDGIVYVSGGTDSTMAPGGTCPCGAGDFDGFLAKYELD